MKNYRWKYNFERKKAKKYHKEQKSQGFTCSHCKQVVIINEFMGTNHRNHCNYCLWSKHVDLHIPGDRKSFCHAGMQPISLTFKDEGYDKYGNLRQGELKIVHLCVADSRISTNRIAADDDIESLFIILTNSANLEDKIKERLHKENILLLNKSDRHEVEKQLFGK